MNRLSSSRERLEVNSLPFLELNSRLIAEQLTLLESDLLRNITIPEFLKLAWTKKDKETRAPRLLAYINWFNIVSRWVRINFPPNFFSRQE